MAELGFDGKVAKLTLEDVRDHFGEMRDEAGYTVPAGRSDELRVVLETIQEG